LQTRLAALAIPIALVVTLAPTRAHAETYTCVIGDRQYSGDQPPPECYGHPYRELNPDGSTRRWIQPPQTPEQRDKAEREKHDGDLKLQAQQEQRRHDRSLLETYASEDEIVAGRDRALSSRQSAVDRAGSTLDELSKERVKLNNEAEFYAKRELPPQLKRQLQENEEAQRADRKLITDIQSEMQRISERFDADRARFHELMKNGATPRRSTAEQPAGSDLSLGPR
jgi:hypothetical protein